MSNDDLSDMQALMGFSEFGRPRKRTKKTASNHDIVRSSRAKVSSLEQLMPATTMGMPHFLPECTRPGPYGVTWLVNPDSTAAALELQVVLNGEAGVPVAQMPEVRTATNSAEASSPSRSISLPATTLELLNELQETKTRFAALDRNAFQRARLHTNPYECLGRHRFINRSAMKMANLDFIFGWTKAAAGGTNPWVFGDLCGGPGGFSEYLLWRREQQYQNAQPGLKGSIDSSITTRRSTSSTTVGYGISLKGMSSCDWKLPESKSGEFHICYGADGTGDLYSIANIHSFRDTLRLAQPDGAHLVVADGGFPDARNQSCQELMMIRLIIAEVTAMFHVLRPGGSFVCKTFELSTPAMLQLVWILHKCFDLLTIVKPITSRPASSERYVVAKNLYSSAPVPRICEILEKFLETTAQASTVDAALLFSNPSWKADSAFFMFMDKSGHRIAQQQLESCRAILNSADNQPKRRARPGNHASAEQYYRCWKLDERQVNQSCSDP